jgi:glutathione S-transferase
MSDKTIRARGLSIKVMKVSTWAILLPTIMPIQGFTKDTHFLCRDHQCSYLKNHRSEKWSELEGAIGLKNNNVEITPPVSIDSVLDRSTPDFSIDHPTLFRERHGWCPYSERVWLIMELSKMEYDTVRIDNTGGSRPKYYSGQTPQTKWPDGSKQGESMDLVYEIDQRYANGIFQSDLANVQECISKFRSIFPRARPSSRAAFLFQMNGEPLWKSTFEETLHKTDALLSASDGPFFCGSNITVADVAWAPFLERYRYQLPCLHDGLDPADPAVYPHLTEWYAAMDRIPEYICRVKGDSSSWRKVLTMAGFGNAGLPPQIQSNMDSLISKEERLSQACLDQETWKSYAQGRPYVQSSPHREAAAIMTRNRQDIVKDAVKQSSTAVWKNKGLPNSEEAADMALRALVKALLDQEETSADDTSMDRDAVECMATFLDHRMCVPRDMGAMAAATIKNLAVKMREG